MNADKHICPEGKVIMCVTFVFDFRNVGSLDIDLCVTLV